MSITLNLTAEEASIIKHELDRCLDEADQGNYRDTVQHIQDKVYSQLMARKAEKLNEKRKQQLQDHGETQR